MLIFLVIVGWHSIKLSIRPYQNKKMIENIDPFYSQKKEKAPN